MLKSLVWHPIDIRHPLCYYGAVLDLRGKRSGKLLALSPTTQRQHTRLLWDTVCDCGRHRLVATQLFTAGYTRSCEDCANARKGPRKHGKSLGPEWTAWRSVKARCQNPKNISYRYYGAKGVSVCDKWGDFQNFLADMGPRPEGTTLGRILDRGNYEPGNVFWMTRDEQRLAYMNNRSLRRWELQNGLKPLNLLATKNGILISTENVQGEK